MTRASLALAMVASVVLGIALAWALSSRPPVEYTGAPGESTCRLCHDGNPADTGGAIELVDAPSLYRPGRTYRITVRLSSDRTDAEAGRRWGFEVTAVRDADGTGAGTFAAVAGEGTAVMPGGIAFPTRSYVGQDAGGTRDGGASPVEWRFDWTAPDPGVGPITLHACGVAADGKSGSNGDWVYSSARALQDTATAVVARSWGQVKASYRR